jgi:hypothetical protein
MPSNARYLLDSDVLISAKNLHYNPQFCGAFWSWIVDAHHAGAVFSIDKVKNELLAGGDKDVLRLWAQEPALSGFFLKSNGGINQWRGLATWAQSPQKAFKATAQAKFLDIESADAWLIAYAAFAGGYTIVTNEKSAPESKKFIKLPDAAAAAGVKTTTLFEVLSQHSSNNFQFSP